MTPLKKRMKGELVLRGYSDRTIDIYLSQVARLARHFNRSPDLLDLEPVISVMLGAPDRGLNRAVLLGLWGRSPLCAVCSVRLLKLGMCSRSRPPADTARPTAALCPRALRHASRKGGGKPRAVQGASRGAPKASNVFPQIHARLPFAHPRQTNQNAARQRLGLRAA